MPFSILFPDTYEGPRETPEAPDFFGDLNLDQVVDGITAGRDQYGLKPFFHTSLAGIDAVRYRQEVFRDLENRGVRGPVETFSQAMAAMRERLAQAEKLRYRYQKEAWFVDAVAVYGEAVAALARDLQSTDVASRGLAAFRAHITSYARSAAFTSLWRELQELQTALSTVRYCLLIKGKHIRVRKYESETDYSADVAQTFAKFRQGAVKSYRVNFPDWPQMNHVEAAVLDLVAKLYPDVFAWLDEYCEKHRDFLDETVARFDREIQFYLAYLEYIGTAGRAGLPFCYPQVSVASKAIHSRDGFDLALAEKLVAANVPVVVNDFHLQGRERILVVTGPNQGGKTTFARAFGQLHFLAAMGCPVPGREARLFLFDRLFTHFGTEEDMENLRGKLEDDLVRIHRILRRATPGSIIIMNEIFTSTTLEDAVFLGKEVMNRIMALDALCVCVTFIDELSSLSEKTVSMVGTVQPENPTVRTFKIIRKAADGLSYAVSIAEKYRLTYESLKGRLNP